MRYHDGFALTIAMSPELQGNGGRVRTFLKEWWPSVLSTNESDLNVKGQCLRVIWLLVAGESPSYDLPSLFKQAANHATGTRRF